MENQVLRIFKVGADYLYDTLESDYLRVPRNPGESEKFVRSLLAE